MTTTTRAGGVARPGPAVVALAAALVLATAGCGSGDDERAQAPTGGDTGTTEQTQAPADGGTDETPAPAGPAEPTESPADGGADASEVTFVAVDIAYDRAPDELTSGEHVFRLVNEGLLPHNVTIEELGDQTVVHVDGGETDEAPVELEPGTYTFYCDVPGHRLAGMEGTLEVTEQSG